jgi:hypothetical protein
MSQMREFPNGLQRYKWEAAHIAVIGGLIVALTVAAHLSTHPGREDRPTPVSTAVSESQRSTANVASRPPQQKSQLSNPREVVVGPNAISGQYILLGVDRKRSTSAKDELTVRLRVVSRAIPDLVTPFQSAMLEVRSRGLEPINPQHGFSHPVPAGKSRDEDIVFMIPSSLSLDRMVLRIHYYNDESEIPLHSVSPVDPD